MIASTSETSVTTDVSRIEMMLNAANRLPLQVRTLFQALYVRNLTEAQACEELGLTEPVFRDRKQSLLRCLKAAAS